MISITEGNSNKDFCPLYSQGNKDGLAVKRPMPPELKHEEPIFP